jgi:hypothetical protein
MVQDNRHVFCTKADHFFVDRTLALYASLRLWNAEADFLVLALTEEAASFLEKAALPNLHVVRLEQVFANEPRLRLVRSDRTEAEFAFTCTPFAVLEALKRSAPGRWVIYLDSDTLCFGPLSNFLGEYNAASTLVTPHNFSDHMKQQVRFGLYNTGVTGFRADSDGEKCAQWWAERCLEWCYDRLEDGKFTDQKYIEGFARICRNTAVADSPGINCAPWNASGREFKKNGRQVLVDRRPLVLYHFAKVKRVTPWCIATRTKLQGVVRARGLNRWVYGTYAEALKNATEAYTIPKEWFLARRNIRKGVKSLALEQDNEPSAIRLVKRILSGEYVACGLLSSPATVTSGRHPA